MATTQETIIVIEAVAEQPAAAESPVEDEALPVGSTKAKKEAAANKEKKTKKVPAPRKRSPATHPPYFEMIKDAIVTMKDKTGSSQYAITKFIEDKHKNLPSNFKKVLLVQLRKLVANDKLVKVKGSFKLPSARPAKPAAAPPKKKSVSVPKPKPKAAAKEKKVASVSKAKPKAKAAAPKPKAAAAAVKAKPAAKAKLAVKPKAKAKLAVKPKAKAAQKRKAPEKSKADKKPAAKVAKTGTRSTPRKKFASVAAPVKKVATPVKKAAAKTVKPKSIAKKVVAKRGRK